MIPHSTVRDLIISEMSGWRAPSNRRAARKMFNALADRLIRLFQFAGGLEVAPTSDMLGEILAEEVVRRFNDKDTAEVRSDRLDDLVTRVFDYLEAFKPNPPLAGLPGGKPIGA